MLERLLEIIFVPPKQAVPEGATSATGLNPPEWMNAIGPSLANAILILIAMGLVILAYSRDGRRVAPRIGMGIFRAALLGFVILLINRPVLRIAEVKHEPSVVAVMIDDSQSMFVRDTTDVAYLAATDRPKSASTPTSPQSQTQPATQPAVAGAGDDGVEYIGGTGPTRLDVALGLLTRDDQKLIRDLAAKHSLKFYRFNRDATEVGSIAPPPQLDQPGGDASASVTEQPLFRSPAWMDVIGADLVNLIFIEITLALTLWLFFSSKKSLPLRVAFALLLAIGLSLLLGSLNFVGGVRNPIADGDKKPSAQVLAADAARFDPKLITDLKSIQTVGVSTQVAASINTVLNNLQGQQVDGVVLLTDARETPAAAPAQLVERAKRFGVKFFPVALGSEKPLRNLSVSSLSVQDSAFKNDIVTAKVMVRATGYEPNKSVRVRLKNNKTGFPLRATDGKEAEATIVLPNDAAQEAEISFQARDIDPNNPSPDKRQIGRLEVVAEIAKEEGEFDISDNVATQSVEVLDAKVNVLYVDGYPRWEYRYIKNEMIRNPTVNIACLLTSADERFRQEGDPAEPNFDKVDENGLVTFHDPRTGSKFPGPITRFPEKDEELRMFDVVLFGDVDPRQFSNRQIKMISDFVENEAGGFGMIAGPQHSPFKYKNTPIDALLPVNIAGVLPDDPTAIYRDEWRPVITDEGRRGEASMMFRFIADKEKNDKYLREDLKPLFWYSRGVTVKEGVGQVYAEHPLVSDATGRRAPILVLGKFGSGRTLFSAIDDSWRWRYYTGESVFDTYWVQQIRYLARGRKLAERGIKFTVDHERYERGQPVRISLTILSPTLLKDRRVVEVEIVDDAGRIIRKEKLTRQESPDNVFSGSFVANDNFGNYHVRLPKLSDTVDAQERTYKIIIPRLELEKPELDRDGLRRLAPETQILSPEVAREQLPKLITGEAKIIPLPPNNLPIWNTWRALTIFMLLLTTEWVLRKVFGML